MPNWFYANGATRAGPHADGEMEQLARTGALSADTLCWNPDFGDTWRPFSQTALYASAPALPSTAADARPRASAASITDVYVWIYAVMPVVVVALRYAVGASGFAPSWLPNTITFGPVGVYAGLAFADAAQVNGRGITREGRKLSPLWFLIAPVYLWRRATFLGRPRTNFWVMIACVVASVGATTAAVAYMGGATVLPACASRGAEAEVRHLATTLAMFKSQGVTMVSLGQTEQVSATDTLRSCKGVMTMSDGSQHPLTYSFEQRASDVYVRIAVQ